ncbi:MAG: hypothetical protein JNM56_32695 [Planctomycetia bacterium]|nr:hypothetical protein [Planctomycetia bacterium]
MSQVLTFLPLERPAGNGLASRHLFAIATLTLMAACAFLAGWAPLGFSIVTVFLFAGPHNWIEIRYFMARMPGRWGKLRPYFLISFAGILGLTASFAALPWLGDALAWERDGWLTAIALWNTLLIGWLVVLIQMRSRQRPCRDWFWTLPVACALLAVNWLTPLAWDLGLVYLHPLIALWILDRELRRSRPAWRPAYHACLACLPLVLGVLWWKLADAPPLPGDDALTVRVTRHAGADILQGISPHLLVATHTFLEALHYAVWVLAIPLVGLKTAPWDLSSVPMAWRSPSWRTGLACVLGVSALVVLALWACFLADYPLTRDIYFTLALFHVLAEAPFLLRAL